MLFYTTSSGPPVGDPTDMYATPLRYKREALAVHTQAHSDARWTQHQADPDSSNTAHSGRRVLRSGGPNHSKPAVFIVFLHLDRTNHSYPLSTHPLGLGGCTTPPGCGFAHHDIVSSIVLSIYSDPTRSTFMAGPTNSK